MPSLTSLEGLSEIGLRGGADLRPTLLRVLTDLYVHKLTHTPEEERHYTELALRLLDSVDVATRAAVAARLAPHLCAPKAVVAKLAADLPDVAAALRHSPSPQPRTARPVAEKNSQLFSAMGSVDSASAAIQAAVTPRVMDPALAGELNELFFAADAVERRLILRNLHIVIPGVAEIGGLAGDPSVGRRLEAAALARRREEFAHELARSLRISRQQAERIAADALGEPIVVAAKILSVPRDWLCRILLFVNTAIGHSVERVHALAALYDDITTEAARDLVAVWQTVAKDQRPTAPHRVTQLRSELSARPTAGVRRPPAMLRTNLRRDAS